MTSLGYSLLSSERFWAIVITTIVLVVIGIAVWVIGPFLIKLLELFVTEIGGLSIDDKLTLIILLLIVLVGVEVTKG
jgi:hypothetical protein